MKVIWIRQFFILQLKIYLYGQKPKWSIRIVDFVFELLRMNVFTSFKLIHYI
jgi:hypothetical protein